MSYFDFMFLTIICALNTSILIVALILINHIDDRTFNIKEMVKEQEPVKPIKGKTPDDSAFDCGACGYPLWEDENYCAHCGKPVLWEGRWRE